MADRTYTQYPVIAMGSDAFKPVFTDYKISNTATAAILTSGNAETFDMADGETSILTTDGGSPETATYNTADFVDIDAGTAAEILLVGNTDTAGCTWAAASGYVTITSDTTGSASSLLYGAGTETALGFSTTLVTGRDAAETWYPGMVLQRHASTDDVLIGWDGTSAPVAILVEEASVSGTAAPFQVCLSGMVNSKYIRIIDQVGTVTKPTQDQIKLLQTAGFFVTGGQHA